ncbi:MAG TPA: T9SS type A sorting domain-containing protein, partial [Ignavibacteriaceae bacterium]|nr:T9SS type A sorting domain-containing protein [Ignavibacteriaceae bacterium]
DVEEDETIPTEFKLEQNYPNPFNPTTKIKFAVPERSNVLIKIYDILGSEVKTLVNKEMEAGRYDVEFNAGGYSSGIYLFRMEAGNYVNTKKMILLR